MSKRKADNLTIDELTPHQYTQESLKRTTSDPGTRPFTYADVVKSSVPATRQNSLQLEANVNSGMKESRYNPFTQQQRDDKVANFEAYLVRRAEEIANGSNNNDYIAQEITIEEPKKVASAAGPKKIYKPFFIGRGNPVHDGHEYAMVQMLNMVIEAQQNGSHSIGLILLGSGPNGGERTMDNPITFELKADIIRGKLASENYNNRKGFKEGRDYIIQRMTNPARDVSNFVKEGLPDDIELDVKVIHIAGDKGGDVGKLNFIEKPVRGSLPAAAAFSFGSSGLVPKKSASGKDMSATEVRKDAYIAYLQNNPKLWKDKYRWFYGDLTDRVYDEILFPLKNIIKTDRVNAITTYIRTGTLPIIKKSKKGGSKTKKRRTQRKKRRTTRRT
jgi:hypothetical protein